MGRFSMNRRWAFILALGVSLVWCLVTPLPGSVLSGPGDAFASKVSDTGDPNGGGGNGAGDPDFPSGSARKNRAMGGSQFGTGLDVQAAGDSRSSGSAGVWRLRVVLESLRGYWFRF